MNVIILYKNFSQEKTGSLMKAKKLINFVKIKALYSQLRFYGIKSGLKISHKENRKVLAKYMRMNKKEFTAEDLDRYYSYKIHRATSAKYHSDNKADHLYKW